MSSRKDADSDAGEPACRLCDLRLRVDDSRVTHRLRSAVVLGTNLAIGAVALAWVLPRYGAPAFGLLASRLHAAWFGAFVVASTLAVLAYARRWQVMLAALGARCGIGVLGAIRAAGQTVSALLPSAKLGGEPLRVFLLVRHDVPAASSIATVVVDRILEMVSATVFACLYATVLLRRGVPGLHMALVTVVLATLGLVVAVTLVLRRLRRGAGLVATVARGTGLDRLAIVRGQMHVLVAAEEAAARLVGQPARLGRAFALGVAANLVVLVEYHLLLRAFGLPAGLLAVVAAVFATGAAHSLPVPAAVGALEAGHVWLFGMLGHPPEVGLAVGFAVRLRELLWMLLGFMYLLALGVWPITGARAVWRADSAARVTRPDEQ